MQISPETQRLNYAVDSVIKNGVEKFAHTAALRVFMRDGNFEAIVDWVRQYFQRLDLSSRESVKPRANSWNETAGYGLQSFSMPVLRGGDAPNSEGRLLRELPCVHHRAPTIGLEAPGMLGGQPVFGEVHFPVKDGHAERITGLSPAIHMQSGGTGPVGVLRREDKPILVTGPGVVRTYLELRDCPPEMQRQITQDQVRGVYACEFLMPPDVADDAVAM